MCISPFRISGNLPAIIILNCDTSQVFVKQLKFVEDFCITDYKLLLCTIACCFSLFALGYDYVSPFPKSIYVLATCAVSYPSQYCVYDYDVVLMSLNKCIHILSLWGI